MSWNYSDFGEIDHRMKLFCELTLCQEAEEAVYLVAKASIKVHTYPRMFIGVVAVSNKNIHVLKMTQPEKWVVNNNTDMHTITNDHANSCREDPATWLDLVANAKCSDLLELKLLLGSQGVSFQFAGSAISVLFRDTERTNRFISQVSSS